MHMVHPPPGSETASAAREQLGCKYGDCEVPSSVHGAHHAHASQDAKKQSAWNGTRAQYQQKEPELAQQFER